MKDIIVSGQFVKPYFIEDLGCEGLSLKDIALSLGIEYKHAKEAYDKNQSDYSGVDISTPTGNPVKPFALVPHLTADDAKFFATQSRTPSGKGYCRYLIECEKVVDVLAECSPELRYLIKMDVEQKRQAKELAQVQATLQATGSSLQDATLTSSQIQALEVLFSEMRKVSNDHKVVSRTKRAIKEQFLQCAKAGCTYKDVAAKHFNACTAMVQAQIRDQQAL